MQIREQFAGAGIVYIEYFYPLMYTVLLGVSANSFLFDLKRESNTNIIFKIIDDEDNVVPKLCFWPTLLGSVCVIAAVVLLPENHAITHSQDKNQALFESPTIPGQEYKLGADQTQVRSLVALSDSEIARIE